MMESIQDVFSGNYEGAWVLALGICSYAIQSYVSFKTVSSKANGKPVSVEIERQEKDVETMNENDKLMKHSNNTLEKDIPSSKLFHRFQKTYLLVYLIMTSADWLQGPYLYAVYDLHGFSMNEIGRLFIVGFVSSAVFGPWVGSLSDSIGRKKMCLVFGALYILNCLMIRSSSYGILLLGRFLSGIATSILFSSFEAWMIKKHNLMGFSDEQLKKTFSLATRWNGFIAILSGIFASLGVLYWNAFAPFNMATILLFIGSFFIASTWDENYGDANQSSSNSGILPSLKTILDDPKIWSLGLCQTCFEASMYIFVFLWTPVLESASFLEIAHGWIFAAFMICITIGSSIYEFISKDIELDEIGRKGKYIFATASFAFLLSSFQRDEFQFLMLVFSIFELCCGVYFPWIGTLRSKYIPENSRATIMTLFRIPLNIIVAGVLYNSHLFSKGFLLSICAILQLFSLSLALALERLSKYGIPN